MSQVMEEMYINISNVFENLHPLIEHLEEGGYNVKEVKKGIETILKTRDTEISRVRKLLGES